MTTTPPDARILLVDDGELEEVARVLDARGLAYERLRGGGIPDHIAPPLDLLIVTPRHLERVRRGSPAAAEPGRPLRIIAVDEDSPAMRRRLRRAGLHLLVRLSADAEIWRLLIERALYRGSERRGDERVAVGSPVSLSDTEATTILVDLSNRGCRLQTEMALSEGDPIAFTLPAGHESGDVAAGLTLRGTVRRIVLDPGSDLRTLAVVFDAELPEMDRTRLTALINRWASGPDSIQHSNRRAMPAIPPCRLAELPDLMLDDETDPPIAAHGEVRVHVAENPTEAQGEASESNRRSRPRGRYESTLVAEGAEGSTVMIGRDLSARGIRVERIADLAIGDRFQIALHGPLASEPFILDAEVARDDGDEGFALVFDSVDAETERELEKLVACLPDVESLDDGEVGGLGAILSEIIRD